MTPSARWRALVFAASFLWFAAWAVHLNPHHLPLSQDEVAYVYQARIFATGRTAVSPAKVPEGFDAEAICTHGDRRFGGYPPGLPLVLAAFRHLGAMWLGGPVVLALTVTILFGTAWRLAGPPAAFLAAACALLSRGFVFAAPIYVSEPLAMLCVAALAHAVLTGGAGLFCAAALMAVRPVTGVALLGCGFLALDNPRRVRLAAYAVFWFAANAALVTAIAGTPATELYRFWGQAFVEAGWNAPVALGETAMRVVGSFTDSIPQAAPVLALWAAARRRELWFVPAAYLALAAIHVVRYTSGHQFIGARYLVPASPLLILAAVLAIAKMKRFRPLAVAIVGLGCVQLALVDAPSRARAMDMRRAVDPGLLIQRENLAGRTLILCRTEHFERDRPGFRADDYYLGFHWNGLEESGDVLFARDVARERLIAVYRPERILTVEWYDSEQGPRCRLKPEPPRRH